SAGFIFRGLIVLKLPRYLFLFVLFGLLALESLQFVRAIVPSALQTATFSISATNAVQPEGNSGDTTIFEFTVTRCGDFSVESTVQFETIDDTATVADGDYVAASGTLIFPPDDTNPQVIEVQVIGDDIPEATEFFFVRIFNPVNAVISGQDQIQGVITDDDTVTPGQVI